MVIKTKKENTGKELDKKIRQIKPAKVFKSSEHYGKVKWEEDPVVYQKSKRYEWD
ncbi:MAG: hypothetical protein LAT84_06575 [Balneolia bacterium]|nr:hypothetical protein [Balneolia bacterium]